MLAERVVRPTYELSPPGKVESWGPDYRELAESAGLILDPWQAEFLDGALGTDAADNFIATRVGLIVPRQNGKDAIAECLELGALFLSNIPKIIHTTHRYKTTMEHYDRVSTLIKECPELDKQVRNYYTANGNCSIVLRNGKKLLFLAREGGAGRGFAGIRLLIMNEAMRLSKATMGDVGPTQLTRRDRQIWYMSSPPRAYSEVLHEVRAQVVEPGVESKRLYAWVYENESGTEIRRPDRTLNVENLAPVNPSYPHRISIEAFEDVLADMGIDEFVIECGGIPEMPEGLSVIIGQELWKGCENPADFDPWVFTADVSYDRQRASIVAGGLDVDGRVQVELIPARSDLTEPPAGVEWVVPRLLELVARHKPRRVYIDPKVSGSMLDELLKAGLPLLADQLQKLNDNRITQKTFDKTCCLTTITTVDVARAAGAFFDAVTARTVAHRGQIELNAAVDGARSRPLADAWAWDRRKSEGDVTPLIAATLAHFAVVQLGERTKPKARVVNLADAMAQLEAEKENG